MAFGSDEEELYEQTLQYIAQHTSSHQNDIFLFDPDS
jgi:GAF domain-containing protein